jgi:hypothetical protein
LAHRGFAQLFSICISPELRLLRVLPFQVQVLCCLGRKKSDSAIRAELNNLFTTMLSSYRSISASGESYIKYQEIGQIFLTKFLASGEMAGPQDISSLMRQ